MTQHKDGGAALRDALGNARDMDCYLEARSGDEIITDIKSVMAPTLTLRDYFAAAALTGLVASPRTPKTTDDSATHITAKLYADLSYKIADAMLKSRALASRDDVRGE